MLAPLAESAVTELPVVEAIATGSLGFAAALEAGVVWVNCFGDGDMTQPFGGYKQSGNTRDKSMECLSGYMQSKAAWINIA